MASNRDGVIEGITLRGVLAHGSINPDRALGNAVQVASALLPRDDCGVVHSDINGRHHATTGRIREGCST